MPIAGHHLAHHVCLGGREKGILCCASERRARFDGRNLALARSRSGSIETASACHRRSRTTPPVGLPDTAAALSVRRQLGLCGFCGKTLDVVVGAGAVAAGCSSASLLMLTSFKSTPTSAAKNASTLAGI